MCTVCGHSPVVGRGRRWKEASVFVFEKKVAEKLHKPRRREVVTDLLRNEVSPAQVTAARAQSGREWVRGFDGRCPAGGAGPRVVMKLVSRRGSSTRLSCESSTRWRRASKCRRLSVRPSVRPSALKPIFSRILPTLSFRSSPCTTDSADSYCCPFF